MNYAILEWFAVACTGSASGTVSEAPTRTRGHGSIIAAMP